MKEADLIRYRRITLNILLVIFAFHWERWQEVNHYWYMKKFKDIKY